MAKEGNSGLNFKRYFTDSKKSVYEMFEYEKTDIDITDDSGEKLFIQKNSEFPVSWSPLARKIVASKYFFGEQGTPDRENSIKKLVGRVNETFSDWAKKQKYFSSKEAEIFREELAYLSLSQKMSFNSPVWFNVGVNKIIGDGSNDVKNAWIISDKNQIISFDTEFGPVDVKIKRGQAIPIPLGRERFYPQTSACFIQGVKDNMEDIMALATKEALLFKYGSGTGTNLSTLRSSHEKLSGGGVPSGPLAYWAFYDKVAGIVKSGGKTRRAAKMDILDISHPDILSFIESKTKEEKKLRILVENGIKHNDAQESVNYQNTNISIRVNNNFMEAVEKDEEWQAIPVHNKELKEKMPKYKAKDLIKKIAEATHSCGDPGLQFDDTINKWHTCPNSGRINASNPCSEYMFIDDSSCNLASQNLMTFMKDDGTFDIESFSNAVRLTAIAQDLLIDNSSFPTKKIADNSHKFRPLGMGYANLGSLVMSLGLPYDSDESRATASAITALLTGKVYETSTEMAETLGTFEEFEKNKEPMLNVMKMHKNALKKIDKKKLPKGLEGVLSEAEKTWENVIHKGNKYGFRNAQATVLAPTGTIGFMMDCDTKGIEPEIGLVQTKLLSGGGTLRLVNSTVEKSLNKLGYNKAQIEEIIKYISKNETIEGAPYIEEKHLPIFDCSNKPRGSKRTISPEGHLKMMAAVQPFLSGAISKTVNLPEEATIENIEQTYIDAWKLGLKSVALYRDGSKTIQPLNFTKKKLEEMAIPQRRKLPGTRKGTVHKYNIAGHEGYLTVGLYDDGTPGELFITMSKEGSTIGGLMDTMGVLTSFALQWGIPLKDIASKMRNNKFEPYGIVLEGGHDIHTATSIPDYIYHWLLKEFCPGENTDKASEFEYDPAENKLESEKELKNNSKYNITPVGEIGGFCPVCGKQMYKRGECNEVCECGYIETKGCGQ